jgi:hypothetical protein
MLLLGDKNQAHAAFADLFDELVRANDRAGAFGLSLVRAGLFWFANGCPRHAARLLMGPQEEAHLVPELVIGSASLVQVSWPFFRPMAFHSRQEDLLHDGEVNAHDTSLLGDFLVYLQCEKVRGRIPEKQPTSGIRNLAVA